MADYDAYVEQKVAQNQTVAVQKTSQHNAIINQISENLRTEEATVLRNETELHAIQNVTSSKVQRTGLIEKDMALVVPAFQVFLDSLATGLQSYTSGVTGKNVIVGGSYHCAMGSGDYMPRRYL